MSKSFRIRTTPGNDNGYLKVNVDLNQNYDHLEILSLKISQNDDYQSFCAEYGVIAGRVIINNGFGVPNVRVSIFVPVDEGDLNDSVKSAIYPYTEPFPDQKNKNGIRYNVLPKNQQTLDHTPVGTFPKKREVLDNNTTLEIYEKYYKYTTTTNEAGDYILFGVPVGDHFLHYDMDVSDIGFLSVRPFELIEQGYSDDLFKDRFKFKSSNNLDSLPQIFSENIPVRVEPYWCDSLSVGNALGINRYDISINNLELVPTAIFMGSVFTDDEKDSLNKNCKPAREMGKMNEVVTGPGNIEAIRRTVDGAIEKYSFKGTPIDENGNWSLLVPMNMRKVVTDEFGNLVPSPDGIKGVATEGDYRFRISIDATSNDKRLRQRAKFLVPNTNNNFNFSEYNPEDLKNSQDFTINQQLSTITTGTPYASDLRNQYNYLEEFYPFRWKKVYTVKQYIGRMQKIQNDEARGFIGIKDILNAEGVNKFPTNRIDINLNPIYSIICLLLTLFGHVVGIINGILNIINGLITTICSIKIPVGITIELMYCIEISAAELCNASYKTAYPCGEGLPKCNDKGCRQNCEPTKTIFDFTIKLKWKCIFSPLLCNKCKGICPGAKTHSCCPNSYGYNGCGSNALIPWPADEGVPDKPCCEKCCVKIPLIGLNCSDEGKNIIITLIPTPFGNAQGCNSPYVPPFSCINCGGIQTPGIKDWVSCVMEPVAVFLRMLKFDFYNDWVGGSLYFPLIKRKYKLKKSKRKFGQIKKDKFCDFDCRERFPIDSQNFQGDPSFTQWRIKIPTILFSNPRITVDGCSAKVKGRRVTEWYGTEENDAQTPNLDLAVKELEFKGKTISFDGCVIKFDTFASFQNTFNTQNIPFDKKDREVSGEHGKPEYVESVQGNGITSWENIGGHGHHRNICDNTRMIERKEYFKTSLDCVTYSNSATFKAAGGIAPESSGFDEFTPTVSEEPDSPKDPECETYNCEPDCGSNGVAPCVYEKDKYEAYTKIVKHGLVSWWENEIYYTPYIPKLDVKVNNIEYKANLMLPTTIMELGSSVFCDIDDVPFILESIPTTTFNVSYEEIKYKIGTVGQYSNGTYKDILKFDDRKDISLNLRAYVEFSCFSVVCSNIAATVNQSQLGVSMIDTNDIGIEIGNCFLRFEHDEDVRQYFCKRFNGYKSHNLNFHHSRPGSNQFDNDYQTYPSISLSDGSPLYYKLDGEFILSEYNDGDSFIPGDACGYKNTNNTSDYFYGLAPGQTSSFINYPNGLDTINFGKTAHPNDVDVIINDPNNGSTSINGITFNRTQTPYYLYFGLVPGKTSLHKTVSLFFADKISATTLKGLGVSNDKVDGNVNNTPNINNGTENKFTVYKTCLGETLIKQVTTP